MLKFPSRQLGFRVFIVLAAAYLIAV